MRKNLRFTQLFTLCIAFTPLAMLSGCMNLHESRTVSPDGTTKFEFGAVTLFGNSAISKLDVDHKTDKTYGGLKIGSIDNETATDAIRASGEAFGNALGTALKKSLVPTP